MTTTESNSTRIARARHLLALLKQRHEQFIDAIVDSVQVAVNQVQDKRVEFQEMALSSPESIFFDVMIDLLPVGSFLHWAAKEFTKENLESLMRSRAAFSSLAKEGYPVLLQVELKEVFDAAEKINMKQYFLRNADLRQLYSANVFDFFGNIDVHLASMKNKYDQLQLQIQEIDRLHGILSPLDSPGTAILNSVFSAARQLKYSQNSLVGHFDLLLNEISTEQVLEQAENFIRTQLGKTGGSYEHLKKSYILWFEFCIWVKIYNPRGMMPGTLEPDAKPHTNTLELKARDAENENNILSIVPSAVVTYLINRIINSPYFSEPGERGLIQLQRTWRKVSLDMQISAGNLIGNIVR